MVRVLKSCVVNGVEFAPDPDALHDESRFGPYLRELTVDGAVEFAEPEAAAPGGPAPIVDAERRTSFGTKRK